MKLQVPRSLLLGALNRVAPVIGDSKQHPILRCVLVRINDGLMSVCATDHRVTVIDSFAVETSESESFCVEFGALHDWTIHSFVLGREMIDITINKTRVQFGYGNSSSKISLARSNESEYPQVISDVESEQIATAQGGHMATAIQRTINVIVLKYAEDNPVLVNGVMIVNKGELSFIASDGHVMGYVKCKADVAKSGEFVIPLKVLTALDGMLSSGGIVRISQSGNKLFFQYDGTMVYTSLSKSSFPVSQSKQMLSVDHPGKTLVFKDGVMRAINSFRGLVQQTEERRRSILARFDVESKTMTIMPDRSEGGEGEESLPVQQIVGRSCDFSINYGYWLNCLKAIDGLEAWIHYDPDNLQNWIHITGTNDSQRYVVAPFARNN